MSVTYTATLTVREETVLFVSRLLHTERLRRGTRTGTRALGCFKQAVLVIRWFCDGTRLAQLATDNATSETTAYDYLHEGIDVLAAQAPGLKSALLAARVAGYSHVIIDGTLIQTDRVSTPGPTPGVDLWWSGKHHNHGGNVQVVTAPDGWPLWTSEVRPGREHDTTAVRTHTEILPALADVADDLRPLGDLGYEGEADTITVAFKKPKHGTLTNIEQQFNRDILRWHNTRRNATLAWSRGSFDPSTASNQHSIQHDDNSDCPRKPTAARFGGTPLARGKGATLRRGRYELCEQLGKVRVHQIRKLAKLEPADADQAPSPRGLREPRLNVIRRSQ